MAAKNAPGESWAGVGCLIILGIVGYAGYYIYGWANDSQYWYALHYDIPESKVTRPAKPHDCEWSAAPIGDKNCHYKVNVYSVRTATDQQGHPITSYDEGKTWSLDDGSAFTYQPEPNNVRTISVSIGWEKVED